MRASAKACTSRTFVLEPVIAQDGIKALGVTIGITFRTAGPKVSPIHSVELALTSISVTRPVVLLTTTRGAYTDRVIPVCCSK